MRAKYNNLYLHSAMRQIALILYSPRKDREQELVEMLQNNIPVMRKLGLITDREQILARTKDGSIIQLFEWKSEESQDQAMAHPVVQEMWLKVGNISEFQKPAAVAEFNEVFSMFETIY
jgi:hypothetical protein